MAVITVLLVAVTFVDQTPKTSYVHEHLLFHCKISYVQIYTVNSNTWAEPDEIVGRVEVTMHRRDPDDPHGPKNVVRRLEDAARDDGESPRQCNAVALARSPIGSD